MNISNLLFVLALTLFSISSCTQATPEKNISPDADLEDIVELPPQKKVNQAPTPAKINDSKERTTIGIFTSIEKGDYYFLNVKDEKDKILNFNIWKAYEGAADLNVGNWKSVKGKKVKVTWETSKEKILESGHTVEIKKLLAVEILD